MGEQRPEWIAPPQGEPSWGPPPENARPWSAPPQQGEPWSGPSAQPQHPHAWPQAPQGEPAWGPPRQGEPAWGPPPQGEPVWAPPQGDARDPWRGRPLVGEERGWVPAAHWLPLLTSWLGPLFVLLTVGERNARVREHAKESLNFEITVWIGILLAALLTYVLVGYLFLVVLPLLVVVLRITAVVESARGRHHRYPFALRLIR